MKLDKDPSDTLDYKFDFSELLQPGETIASHLVVAPGCIVGSEDVVGDAVVAWISGGTLGTVVKATCHITTNEGRQADGTILLNITNL